MIVVDGALCDRSANRPLAEQLAPQFTVVNYDRRGRGDSGDTAPYAVEREIEDLGALIASAGGTAAVYGHSSGAAVVLHAAAHGLPIARFVMHEPPYSAGSDEEVREARRFAEDLERLLADDRHGDAVELFMTITGMPPEMIAETRAHPGRSRRRSPRRSPTTQRRWATRPAAARSRPTSPPAPRPRRSSSAAGRARTG